MKHDLSFEIPRTPESLDCLEKFLKESEKQPKTIYGEIDGELLPICNIERHPDCPIDIYNAFINYLMR